MNLRRWFSRERRDENMNDELRFHIEQQTAENIASGMAPAEARRQARLQFGALEGIKENCREQRRGFWLEELWADVRYGVRILGKNPGFAAAATLTLALGIGASTAVFSLVNAILLKPLAYRNPDQMVMIWNIPPPGVNVGFDYLPWGRFQFLEFAPETKTLAAIGAFESDSFNLTGSGEPARLEGVRASAGFFPALGVSPVLGRTFAPEEDRQGHEQEVVIGYALWQERFGGDAAILGRVLELNGNPFTVIGVMPSGFAFPRAENMPAAGWKPPRDVRLWVPLALVPGPLVPADPWELGVVGRLKPGMTLAQARAEMAIFSKRIEAEFPPQAKGWFECRFVPLAQQVSGDVRRPLLLILGAVGVVLLIACSNVASLLLARSIARRREFTLRTALGASRGRLIRQLLTESLLLAAAGGLVGVLFAEAGIRFTRAYGPGNLPRLRDVGLDLPVLAFALGAALVTGILFGLAPALAAGRENLAGSLRAAGQRLSGGAQSSRLRKILLVSEMALAVVLLVAAGLLTRTFFRLLGTDPGFHATHALTFEISLPASRYAGQPHIVALYRNALDRLRAIPGVQSAGIVETVPMSGATESTGIRIPGRTVRDPHGLSANYTMVSPGYFRAMGTPILRGRDFLETDTADSEPVTVIGASMGKKFWPGEDPLGKHVGPGSPKYPVATIVGIAADVKHQSLREETLPEMYVLYAQKVWPSLLTMDVVLRTNFEPGFLTASVRDAIRSADPDLPLSRIATLSSLVDDSVARPKFSMLLLTSFGAIALLLAAIGMYGVVSYSVAQRTQEIGIRMALGAQRGGVFRDVLGQGGRQAGLGILIGFIAALGVTRLMASFLYGVHTVDALSFAAAALILLGVALLACYIPARRAMRLDPMTALRYE